MTPPGDLAPYAAFPGALFFTHHSCTIYAASRGGGRCSKQPKAAKFGRQNPLCARWNIPEQLLDWREAWADAMNRVITAEREQALFRERRVDDPAISLAKKSQIQKSRMFTAPLNSRTFPKAITKISDKRPAAAFFAKAAAVIKVSILRIFRPSCRRSRRCRYSTRWNCCRP